MQLIEYCSVSIVSAQVVLSLHLLSNSYIVVILSPRDINIVQMYKNRRCDWAVKTASTYSYRTSLRTLCSPMILISLYDLVYMHKIIELRSWMVLLSDILPPSYTPICDFSLLDYTESILGGLGWD